MKKEYISPEYENNNQLADVILVSVIQEDNKITGIVDIEDLFG